MSKVKYVVSGGTRMSRLSDTDWALLASAKQGF